MPALGGRRLVKVICFPAAGVCSSPPKIAESSVVGDIILALPTGDVFIVGFESIGIFGDMLKPEAVVLLDVSVDVREDAEDPVVAFLLV